MKIRFTGNFWDYFLKSLGLLILSVISFGILLPYYAYWNAKYFFDRLVIDQTIVVNKKSV